MSLLLQASQAPAADATLAEPAAALAGLVVLIGGLTLSPLAVVAARLFVPERRLFFARWRFGHVLAIVVLSYSGLVLAAAGLGGLGLGLPEVLLAQLATALGLALGAVGIALVARRFDPAGLRSLGWAAGGHLRAVLSGWAAYVICLPALFGTILLWPWLWERLGGHWQAQEVAMRLAELSGAALVSMLLLAVIVQPFLEELFFRAFLQPLLVQNLGDRGGIALTSLFFAALHGGGAFLPVFALSLLLGAVMLRSQRLSAAFAVHALHNGIMVSFLILWPEARELLAPEALAFLPGNGP